MKSIESIELELLKKYTSFRSIDNKDKHNVENLIDRKLLKHPTYRDNNRTYHIEDPNSAKITPLGVIWKRRETWRLNPILRTLHILTHNY